MKTELTKLVSKSLILCCSVFAVAAIGCSDAADSGTTDKTETSTTDDGGGSDSKGSESKGSDAK